MRRVLLIEDSPHTVKSQIAEARRAFNVDSVVLPETAVRRLREKKYDFVVIDATLPTDILEKKDGNFAGYSFYDEYVSRLMPDARIIFWDRKTERYFDKEKYSDKSKFIFLHKTKDRFALRHALESFDKDKENSIIIDGMEIRLDDKY